MSNFISNWIEKRKQRLEAKYEQLIAEQQIRIQHNKKRIQQCEAIYERIINDFDWRKLREIKHGYEYNQSVQALLQTTGGGGNLPRYTYYSIVVNGITVLTQSETRQNNYCKEIYEFLCEQYKKHKDDLIQDGIDNL